SARAARTYKSRCRKRHVRRNAQMLFRRRRHQPSRPPPAKIKPGRPAPAMGTGTAAGLMVRLTPDIDEGRKTPVGSRNVALKLKGPSAPGRNVVVAILQTRGDRQEVTGTLPRSVPVV